MNRYAGLLPSAAIVLLVAGCSSSKPVEPANAKPANGVAPVAADDNSSPAAEPARPAAVASVDNASLPPEKRTFATPEACYTALIEATYDQDKVAEFWCLDESSR